MSMLLVIVVGTVIALVLSAAVAQKMQPKTYAYTCKGCGCEVTTTDRLDGWCATCWDKNFESASERLDDLSS